MECQRTIYLLDNTSNQISKFRTKKWIEINGQSKRTYDTNIGIRFKTTMLKSNLCDYSDVYILVKERTTITEAADNPAARWADEGNKGVMFKNGTPNELKNADLSPSCV